MGQPIGGGKDTANPLIQGSFTATGESDVAIFYGPYNFTVTGTFVGAVQIQRSFDGGSTWAPLSTDALGTANSFTSPASLMGYEPEHQTAYRIACTDYTSGTIGYRLSEASDNQFIGGLGR